MSRRKALKLARDAGLVDKVDCSDDWFVREDAGIEQVVQFAALIAESELERNLFPVFARFAARVAAREREACAKVAESFDPEQLLSNYGFCIANKIRARGEEKPYAAQAATVASQTHGRMQIDPATGDVSIGAIRATGEQEQSHDRP